MLAGQRRAAVLRRGVAPPGFARNGATNAATRAMLARVKAGTGRGRIVWKGDSTIVGQGGGSGAPYYLAGARGVRPAAAVAALLSASGCPALDNGMVGDNGVAVAANLPLPAYDPRVAVAVPAWVPGGGIGFAGGNYLQSGTGALDFTPGTPVDTFEIVYYNSNSAQLTFLIDGAPPATGPATAALSNSGGFTRVTVKAASAATRTLRITANNNNAALRSILAFDSGLAAIDQIVHASLGASSANQAAAGGWLNNDALGFDAPDLTIVSVGYNDQNGAVPATTFAANVQAIVSKARSSGDVLVVAQPPAGGTYNGAATAYRDAVLALGAANAVSTLNLFDALGGGFTGALAARMADGAVHPGAELYDDLAGRYARAILAMGR